MSTELGTEMKVFHRHNVPSPIRLSPLAARRFVLRAQGFTEPFANVDAALLHLGYVQIDPLNICGRMHDLILRNRIANYHEGDLMRHVHGESVEPRRTNQEPALSTASELLPSEKRTAFEHHLPDTNVLVVFPWEAWPHLRAAMRARAKRVSAWSGRLTPTERKLVPSLLAEIADRGPLSSDDFSDPGRAHRTVWGSASLVKSTLQKLFFHGELLIAGRSKHRRRYDLPSKVAPAAIIGQRDATAAETSRWLAHLKLRQRRLVALKRAELPLVADETLAVAVEGCPPLHCLKADAELLEQTISEVTNPTKAVRASRAVETDAARAVRLLAPLDPVIYDRRVTAVLWNFNYTWEAYVPPSKRVRGHYALPVLDETELVGHVEPKADRATGKLVIASRAVRRGTKLGRALDEFAAWLGLRR